MWQIQPITTRFFVWLAAIAIPFQGLPSAMCSCVPVDARTSTQLHTAERSLCSCSGAKICCCGEASSCCQPKFSCCSSSTSSEAACQCGDHCQCGTSSLPAEPAIPPVENSSPERITGNSASIASFTTVYLPSIARQSSDLSVGVNALTALESCVSLCRFTLWASSFSAAAHHPLRASLRALLTVLISSRTDAAKSLRVGRSFALAI